MPVALPTSRDLVKELWLQGFSHKDIEKQTGVKPVTLRQWIVRLGWKRDGDKIIPPKEERKAIVYQGIAERLSNLTATEAERIICHLRDSKLSSIRDGKDSASALSAAYTTARKALGLDDDRVQRVLHVHTMRQARGSSVTLDSEAVLVPAEQPATEAPKASVSDCPIPSSV